MSLRVVVPALQFGAVKVDVDADSSLASLESASSMRAIWTLIMPSFCIVERPTWSALSLIAWTAESKYAFTELTASCASVWTCCSCVTWKARRFMEMRSSTYLRISSPHLAGTAIANTSVKVHHQFNCSATMKVWKLGKCFLAHLSHVRDEVLLSCLPATSTVVPARLLLLLAVITMGLGSPVHGAQNKQQSHFTSSNTVKSNTNHPRV